MKKLYAIILAIIIIIVSIILATVTAGLSIIIGGFIIYYLVKREINNGLDMMSNEFR